MNKDRYPMYGLAIAVGGGLALWAGLSPLFLVFLLVCPLMMFFMMRGMHGGQGNHDAHDAHNHTGAPGHETDTSTRSRRPRTDGSHERIDQP